MRRIDPWIQTGDDEQAQGGEDDRPLVTAGGGERAVARQCDVDVPQVRAVAVGHLESGRPADALAGHRIRLTLISHGLSPLGSGAHGVGCGRAERRELRRVAAGLCVGWMAMASAG